MLSHIGGNATKYTNFCNDFFRVIVFLVVLLLLRLSTLWLSILFHRTNLWEARALTLRVLKGAGIGLRHRYTSDIITSISFQLIKPIICGKVFRYRVKMDVNILQHRCHYKRYSMPQKQF